MEASPPRVLLVAMPYGHLIYPSIGIGLLKARLAAGGIPCDVRHFNIDLVERFLPGSPEESYSAYHDLATRWEFYYPAEAAFSPHVFPSRAAEAKRLLSSTPERAAKRSLFALWEAAGPFLDHCLSSVRWEDYRLVGFSSMFNQNLAIAALAKRLKERYAHLRIVVGGANTEGKSGSALLSAFPWIDFVLSGDSDETFPRLALSLLSGEPPGELPGLATREGAGPVLVVPARPFHDLDTSPLPDYSDFFEQVASGRLASVESLDRFRRIPYETSRGCWWGETSQCTFCGLNGLGMAYRRKSENRILEEISALIDLYRPKRICCVDNILHHGFFTTLFPLMERRGLPVELSFEVKSNLKRKQVEAMHAVGIREIQPGIESLSTRILRLMKKGATLLDNVRMLRLAEEFRMDVVWLHLYDFPGESLEDYLAVARLARHLCHLPPPVENDTRMTVRRFSPYFDQAEAYGVTNLRPSGGLGSLYDVPPDVLFDLAYRFDADYEDGRSPDQRRRIAQLLRETLAAWRKRYEAGAELSLYGEPPLGVVLDLRYPDPVATPLSAMERRILDLADEIHERKTLLALVASQPPGAEDGAASARRVGEAVTRLEALGVRVMEEGDKADAVPLLDSLVARGFLLEESGRYLSLAIPRPIRLLEEKLSRLEEDHRPALAVH